MGYAYWVPNEEKNECVEFYHNCVILVRMFLNVNIIELGIILLS